MAVKYARKSVTLQGNIAVEEAEELANWLKQNPLATVKIAKCTHLHAAVMQVLLALRPCLQGEPQDPWLRAALVRTTNQLATKGI